MYKICTKCLLNKELIEYSKSSTTKDGLRPECKDCHAIYMKQNYLKNKARRQEVSKQYQSLNKEKITKYQKEYYVQNKDKVLERTSTYYRTNSDKCKKVIEIWRSKNIDRVTKMQRERENIRYNSDIQYRLRRCLRSRINGALKYNAKKPYSTEKLVGCSFFELRMKLQMKFYRNPRNQSQMMTWDNYGEWHIDHITPISKFDMTDKEQILKACNYENLQPLWAYENHQKSNKVG